MGSRLLPFPRSAPEEAALLAPRGAFRQIADELRRLIESGELAPGAMVPSENVLAERFGVARGTVRSALAVLLDDGLLEVLPGQGRRVVGAGAGPSSVTAYGRIAAELLRRIESGEFATSDALPSEAALMAEFDVSRNTVRRAIQVLVDEGAVVVRQGAGAFVAAR